jgi:CheY-like chemotaxis protein
VPTSPSREPAAVRVAVVDDMRINREGTRAVLGSVPGVVVEEPMDFREAVLREDWSGVDYVLVDVADRTRTDTETPGIEVVAHIRAACPERGPTVLAITGDPRAFEEDVVRRRLLEAGADHFIYRDELDRRLEDVILGTEPLEPLRAPTAIPELGITPRTRVNDLIGYLLHEGSELVANRTWGRRDERRLAAARAKGEAHARELNPVNVEGRLSRHGDQLSPGIRQYRRILDRATRLTGRATKGEPPPA